MTPETQSVRLARVESDLKALTRSHEQERRVLEGIAPVTVQVAEHEVRINDMKTDITDLKTMVTSLAENCAKTGEIIELKTAILNLTARRQEWGLGKLSLASAVIVALIGAIAVIAVAIINSGGA
jgi:hypothetical protein